MSAPRIFVTLNENSGSMVERLGAKICVYSLQHLNADTIAWPSAPKRD
jgi:hypothetical protein